MSVSDTAPTPTEQLRIRSAADLMGALNDADPFKRLALLRHISKHAEVALKFGAHEGRDVLDTLIDQARTMPSGDLRYATLITIGNFRDPRVVRFMMEDVQKNTHLASVAACIIRLGEEKTDAVRDLLIAFLDRPADSAHARAAASVLAWWPDWNPGMAQWLRVSLLSDAGRPLPPPVDEKSLDLWLEQLDGDAAERAWSLLELQGPGGFLALSEQWRRLSTDGCVRLLAWGINRCPELAAPRIEDALLSRHETIVMKGLELLAHQPPEIRAHHLPRLQALWHTCEARQTALPVAILHAGLRDLEWANCMKDATDMKVRQALLFAAVHADGLAVLPLVIQSLESPHWQMRALATRLAIEYGEPAIGPAKQRATSERPEVKLAACQVLIGLGQQDWIEEHVL